MSVAATRGYCDILLGKIVVPPQDEVLDENAPNNKAKLKGKQENYKAYNDLTLACSGQIGIAIKDESVTKYLPDSDAELAWRELQRRFELYTSADKIKLKRESNSSNLSRWNQDLEVWIS